MTEGNQSLPHMPEKEESWPPKFYASFTLAEKLEYAVTCKHYSLESGCDAHVELFERLIPQAISTLSSLEKRLAEAEEREKEMVLSLEFISGFCEHDEGGPGELCDCSTPMSLRAKRTLTKLREALKVVGEKGAE